jgi:hypothetical protein
MHGKYKFFEVGRSSPSRVAEAHGGVEVQLSGGETRRFAAGQMVVGEDTTGQGHHTRVVGDEPLVLATVHLPE